jgi:hypothetical protein
MVRTKDAETAYAAATRDAGVGASAGLEVEVFRGAAVAGRALDSGADDVRLVHARVRNFAGRQHVERLEGCNSSGQGSVAT